MTNLNDLSVEIILQIFQYCNIKDLCKLQQTCKRFSSIINTHKIVSEQQNTLVTNQIMPCLKNRSFTLLSPFEKWRVSFNWKIGRYKINTLLKQRKKFMPWLSLDNKYFWISQGKYLKAFRRKVKNVINENSPEFVINNNSEEDIVRFRIKENFVISGLREGDIWIWSIEEKKFIINQLHCHGGDVADVDITNDIFITSSSDKTYSIWPLNLENNDELQPLFTNFINDKIWSIAISPSNHFLAVGTAGFNDVAPFHVFDLESNTSILNLQNNIIGAGILDMHWENENTILTCGYDTYLKKWDLRSGTLVQKWEDPFDSSLYCLASDDLYTVLAGTIAYGRVVLWDQRVSQRYIQLYFTCNSSSLYKSSPVYSIGFDSNQLFAALDQNVTCLDFSNSTGKVRNYDPKYYNYKYYSGSII